MLIFSPADSEPEPSTCRCPVPPFMATVPVEFAVSATWKPYQVPLGALDARAIGFYFPSELHAADIADLLEQIEPEQRSRILFLVPPHVSAGIIVHFDEATRSDVLEDYTNEQLTEVLRELPADDAVDVLDEMDEAVADRLIER